MKIKISFINSYKNDIDYMCGTIKKLKREYDLTIEEKTADEFLQALNKLKNLVENISFE